MIEINKTDAENALILSIKGNLLGENDGKTIIEMVEDSISKNILNVIFDVSELKYINSTGLSTLLSTLTKVRKNGGEMCLLNTPAQLKSLLEITKLDSIIPECSSLENALKKINSK